MFGVTLLVAAAATGVDYGWQPADNGSLEYIIQIEPELVTLLESGQAITSEIPEEVAGVRRFRIQIGEGQLPQEEVDSVADARGGGPAPPPPVGAPAAETPPGAAADTPPAMDSPFAPPATAPPAAMPAETPPAGGNPYRPGSGGQFQSQPSVSPPEDEGSDLFSGSMFGGSSEGVAAGETDTAENETAETNLPPLDSAWGSGTTTEDVAEVEEAGVSASPFTQPDLIPPPPAAEPANFEVEDSAEVSEEIGEGPAESAVPVESPVAAESSTGEKEAAETGRPWGWLVLTLIFLFASLGLNAWLGWILRETLARYRRLRTELAAG